MAKHQYATKPPNITTMPPGVPYIIGNEAAERFSFYGMRSILIVFMTTYMVNKLGMPDRMGDAEARGYFSSLSRRFIFCRFSARFWRKFSSGNTTPSFGFRSFTARVTSCSRWMIRAPG